MLGWVLVAMPARSKGYEDFALKGASRCGLPGFEQSGIHHVRFGVTDTGGASAFIDVQIQVLNVNRPPVLPAISGHVVLVGQPFELQIAGSDPDLNSTIAFAADALPPGAALTSAGKFTWTPLAAQTGEYDITIRLTDGDLTVTRGLRTSAAKTYGLLRSTHGTILRRTLDLLRPLAAA